MLRAENHKTTRQSEVSVLKLFPMKWLRAENVVGRTNQMAPCWKVTTVRAESVVKNSTCWKCRQKQHMLKVSSETARAESVVKTARAESVDRKK